MSNGISHFVIIAISQRAAGAGVRVHGARSRFTYVCSRTKRASPWGAHSPAGRPPEPAAPGHGFCGRAPRPRCCPARRAAAQQVLGKYCHTQTWRSTDPDQWI